MNWAYVDKQTMSEMLEKNTVLELSQIHRVTIATIQKMISRWGLNDIRFRIKPTKPTSLRMLYDRWRNIKNRCYNPRNISFKYYGGREITMCREWFDYRTFEKWALANDFSPELQIDRIDNDGNYEPSNCRWVTAKVNNNNRRCSKKKSEISLDIPADLW